MGNYMMNDAGIEVIHLNLREGEKLCYYSL